MKQQRYGAWVLPAQSTCEARSSILLQSLRRFFALIHTVPCSGRVHLKVGLHNSWSAYHLSLKYPRIVAESEKCGRIFTALAGF